MKMLHIAATIIAASILAACGGGGGGSAQNAQNPTDNNGTPPQTQQSNPQPITTQYDQDDFQAHYKTGWTLASIANNESIVGDHRGAFIGTPDITAVLRYAEQESEYIRENRHGGAVIGYTRLRDGISRNELVSYGDADARDNDNKIWRWGNTPPTVRMLTGHTQRDIEETHLAVRMINSVLPYNYQIQFSNTAAESGGQINHGFIEVIFTPKRNWPDGICGGVNGNAIGCAYSERNDTGRMLGSAIFVDPEYSSDVNVRMKILLHEFLHALGRGHVSRDFDTIMHASIEEHGVGSDWLVLSKLDQATLYAVYKDLSIEPGKLTAEDLGYWSDVSSHAFGAMGSGANDIVFFGATWQNGLVRPYAIGVNTAPPLQQQVSGSARWMGRFIGLTPEVETVAAAMDMRIQLASLHGQLDFKNMEHWRANTGPGVLGTGMQWGDGDLHYAIDMTEGRVFVEIGGDAGQITGMAFGDNHERVGGTLRRHDLAGGFAGTRQ